MNVEIRLKGTTDKVTMGNLHVDVVFWHSQMGLYFWATITKRGPLKLKTAGC